MLIFQLEIGHLDRQAVIFNLNNWSFGTKNNLNTID